MDGKRILVKHRSVYNHVHARRVTHAIDNDDNDGSNNIGDATENASNLSLNNSKIINDSHHLVIDSDDAVIEDNLENNVLSNLETFDKDEESIDDTNNENEYNSQGDTVSEIQNSNLGTISQLTKSIERLSLDANVLNTQ